MRDSSVLPAVQCQALHMKYYEVGGRRGIPRLPEVAEFLKTHGRQDIVRALESLVQKPSESSK